jgi:hypothetical protein
VQPVFSNLKEICKEFKTIENPLIEKIQPLDVNMHSDSDSSQEYEEDNYINSFRSKIKVTKQSQKQELDDMPIMQKVI